MNVTRFRDAPEYFPPNHFGMQCIRLQGREAGPAESLWLGVSTIEPGGHTTMDGSGVEKHYVVLEGQVCVDADGVEVELQVFDSCRLAPGECGAHAEVLAHTESEVARCVLPMDVELFGGRSPMVLVAIGRRVGEQQAIASFDCGAAQFDVTGGLSRHAHDRCPVPQHLLDGGGDQGSIGEDPSVHVGVVGEGEEHVAEHHGDGGPERCRR